MMPFSAPRFTPVASRAIAFALLAALPMACAQAPQTAAAGQAQEVVLTPRGTSALGAYLAGLHAHAVHDTRSAADFTLDALRADPENTELLNRATMLLAEDGRMDDAAHMAQRLLTFDSEATMAAVVLAVDDARRNDFVAAEKRVAGLPRRGLSGILVPLLTAWTRVGQGKIDQALDAIAPLANNSQAAPLYEFHAALINDLADRRKAADDHYRNTLAGTALSLRAVQAVGSYDQRTGRPDQARQIYGRYLQEHPDSLMLTPEALLAQGAALPRPVASARAGMAEVLFGLANSVRQSQASDIALLFGQLALQLEPNSPLIQVMVAEVLQGEDRLVEANKVYASIAPGSEAWWSAQLRIAANLDEMDDTPAAVNTLNALAAQRPDRADPLIALGELLRKHKMFLQSVDAYDRAIARIGPLEPRHWSLLYSRGVALERARMWARAEADLLKALELSPDQPFVLNYLGYSWLDRNLNVDRARKMIERAAALLPSDGYIVDSLGWAMFRAGETAKAVDVMEKAIELRPEDATINEHLGDVLWAVGRFDEARFQWQRALTLNPEPEQIPGIQAKLKQPAGPRTALAPR